MRPAARFPTDTPVSSLTNSPTGTKSRIFFLIPGARVTPGRWHGWPVLSHWQGPRPPTAGGLNIGCRGHPCHRVVAKRCAAQIFASSHCGCRGRSPWPWRRRRSIKSLARARARQRRAALILGAGLSPAPAVCARSRPALRPPPRRVRTRAPTLRMRSGAVAPVHARGGADRARRRSR